MITEKMADFTLELEYEDLPPEVVREVKRFLLDSVGCAFGGSGTKDVKIYLDYLRHIGGREEASVFHYRDKFPCINAALLNSLMIRALDYNDIYWEQDPSHPSDLIPAALSPAEVRGRGGKDLITAIALAYEFEMRMCEIARPGIRERKWHHATLTAFVAPLVAGKIMGLNRDQLVCAVGISGSHQASFGAVTAGHLTMMKNTVDPLAVQGGVCAAELAARGYEGPTRVIDGKEGLVEALAGGDWDVEGLVRGLGKSFRILRCSMKAFPTEALTHSPLTALLELLDKEPVAPSEIEEITIKTIARAVDILADPSKYSPTTRETADHSLPYCIAALVLDGCLTPAQFTETRIRSRDIREMIKKVRVIPEARFEKIFPEKKPAAVEIRTRKGKILEGEVKYPRGDYRNPLTDEELLGKFHSLVQDKIPREKAERIVDTIWKLEKTGNLRELMEILSMR